MNNSDIYFQRGSLSGQAWQCHHLLPTSRPETPQPLVQYSGDPGVSCWCQRDRRGDYVQPPVSQPFSQLFYVRSQWPGLPGSFSQPSQP